MVEDGYLRLSWLIALNVSRNAPKCPAPKISSFKWVLCTRGRVPTEVQERR